MKSNILLHIPHASTDIPEAYLGAFCREKLPHELNVMTDWFCDELFAGGKDAVIFPISRLVCDVERFRDDKDEIMAEIGMGVAYQSASDLSPLRTVTEEEKQAIVSRYYDVHHAALTKAVEEKLDSLNRCLIVDCHSFYPSPLPYELDQNPDRPDFCIGTSEYHTPENITESLVRLLSECGYRVKVNSPFSGTIVPMKYYRKDPRVRSVMIEVNRKLYMESPGVKNDRFPVIRSVLQNCLAMLEELTET